MEAHHIIEKRLTKGSNWKASQMLLVELTKTVYRVYTNAWKNRVPYETRYKSGIAYKCLLYKASNVIYKGNRGLKMAARYTYGKWVRCRKNEDKTSLLLKK